MLISYEIERYTNDVWHSVKNLGNRVAENDQKYIDKLYELIADGAWDVTKHRLVKTVVTTTRTVIVKPLVMKVRNKDLFIIEFNSDLFCKWRRSIQHPDYYTEDRADIILETIRYDFRHKFRKTLATSIETHA